MNVVFVLLHWVIVSVSDYVSAVCCLQSITPEELGEIWKGFEYDAEPFSEPLQTARTSSDAAALVAANSDAAAAAGAARSSFDAPPAAAVPPAAAPEASAVAAAAAAPAAAPPAAVAAPAAAAVQPPAAAAAAQPPAAAAAAAAEAAGQPSLQSLLPAGMVLQALELDQWLYTDPNGNQQGPFTRTDILDWAESGRGRGLPGGGGGGFGGVSATTRVAIAHQGTAGCMRKGKLLEGFPPLFLYTVVQSGL